jgi:hypothetical protein
MQKANLPSQECSGGHTTPNPIYLISPTYKRAEGRAPVWGSEFTSKGATIHGGPPETAAGLNAKFWVLMVVVVVVMTGG